MISIHQPQFLPWIPYFYKLFKSDIFIMLDNVQFQKNGVQNRNMIKTSQGAQWFGIGVSHRYGTPINEVKVANTMEYPKLLKSLQMSYGRSSYYDKVYKSIYEVFDQGYTNLNELNIALMDNVLTMIGQRPPEICTSTHIDIMKKKDDLVIELIKYFDENEYLSGPGGLEYMDLKKFREAKIKVYLYDFKFPPYRQLWNKKVGFLPNLSIIDLLFNDLVISQKYILNNGSIKQIV